MQLSFSLMVERRIAGVFDSRSMSFYQQRTRSLIHLSLAFLKEMFDLVSIRGPTEDAKASKHC